MKRMRYMSLLMLVTVSLTGCASMGSRGGGFGDGLRNKCRAQKAWNEWSWCYDELDHPHHFAKGFKKGYRDVIEGGKGCQPTLPPKCYWKSCYQSSDGRCKVNAWFDGYSHGALAAQQDGAGNWRQIPISPTARMNLRMAASRPQAFGAVGSGTPMPIASPPPPALPATAGVADGGLRLNSEPGKAHIDATDEAVPLRPYE